MDLGEAGAQHQAWPETAEARLWAASTASDHAFAHATGLDQLLAAQLRALQLGSALPAAPPLPFAGAGSSVLPGGLQPGHPGVAPPSYSPRSADQSSPELGQAGSGDLLSQLRFGASLAHHSAPLALGTPSPPQQHHPLAHQLQHAQLAQQQELHAFGGGAPQGYAQPPCYAQQQQQQQHAEPRRPLLPGRRRGSGSAAGAGGVRRNEDKVRRTVYISDISDAVSEAQLAAFFADCGPLVDCRVCGDPNSSMRFAFIEFMEEGATHKALSKSGAMLGDFPIRVNPSKTAIVPVNNTYLPRSTEERELVARTVFVGNVDRVVERDQLRDFFQNLCGPVAKIRLLGDSQHNSKIAFVEFCTAHSAKDALRLSGALLGTLPLRISPSKTPVRGDSRRPLDGRAALSAALPSAQPAAASPGHAALSPALLMAVAGLQAYPAHYQE